MHGATVDVLAALHERLSALELRAIPETADAAASRLGVLWDIDVLTRRNPQSQSHGYQTVMLNTIQNLTVCRQNTTLQVLKSLPAGRTWTINIQQFPDAFSGRVTINGVRIQQELYYRARSNAVPCENMIVKVNVSVQIQDKEFVNGRATGSYLQRPPQVLTYIAKFRKVPPDQPATEPTMTEVEVRKALMISENLRTRGMFPKIRFVCSFSDGINVWEGVMLDELENLTMEQRTSQHFYSAAFYLMKELHATGYIHGDAHTGNFMKLRRFAVPPYPGDIQLSFIDWDQLFELPFNYSGKPGVPARLDRRDRFVTNANTIDFTVLPSVYREKHPRGTSSLPTTLRMKALLLTKIMIIHDYNKLLLNFNPFISTLNPMNQQDIDNVNEMYSELGIENFENADSVVPYLMPWPYQLNMEAVYGWDFDTILNSLVIKISPRRTVNMITYLNTISLEDIDKYYQNTFLYEMAEVGRYFTERYSMFLARARRRRP